MNIMDGMDAARFKSANPKYKTKENEKEAQKEEKEMPMVLRNLNNK